jgi:chromosome partitioning protein
MFLNDEGLKPFINPSRISRSSMFRKYINKANYQLDEKSETRKGYDVATPNGGADNNIPIGTRPIGAHEEVKNLIHSILGVTITEAI